MTQSAGQTIARNAAAISAGTLILKALNFLFRIYVVRALGDELFGEYSIVIAFVGLFQIIAEPGITQYVMREIARDRSTSEVYFWNLIALRLLLAAFSMVLITAAAFAFGYSPTIVIAIFLYTLTFVLSAFDVPMATVIVANERYDYVTALNVVGQVAFMLLGVLVLISGHGIILLVAAGLLAMLPQMFLAARIIHRHGYLKSTPSISPKLWRPLLVSGLPFGITTLALVIAQSIDTVMLSWFWPAAEVGWYNAAYRLALSTIFLFDGFNRALVPSLARIFVTDKAYVNSWYSRSTRAIAFMGLPIAVGGMLVAEPLILLLYGEQFAPAVPVFQILIWDVPFVMFAALCGNITTIINKEKVAARVNVINATANVVLNLIFIPRYGLMAAAVITVVTDLLAAVQFHLSLSRDMHMPNLMSVLLRTAAAAALMGAIVVFANGLPLFARIGIGIVAYGIIAAFLRLLDEDDWNALRRLLKKGRSALGHAEAVH